MDEGTVHTLALVGAAIAFMVGIYQYTKAQRWKRSEFVAAEIKAMQTDAQARSMMQMLDWDGRQVDLFPELAEGRWVLVHNEQFASALRVPAGEDDMFAPIEARIRDVADAFLEHLNRFGHFVEVELVEASEFQPYLKYWFDMIADRHDDHRTAAPEIWRPALQRFIAEYDYRGVIRLSEAMGYRMDLARSDMARAGAA